MYWTNRSMLSSNYKNVASGQKMPDNVNQQQNNDGKCKELVHLHVRLLHSDTYIVGITFHQLYKY